MERSEGRTLLKIVLIAAFLLVSAFADFIVLERVYKPVSNAYSVPWGFFEIGFLGIRCLWWHIALYVIVFSFFILQGIAMEDWRVSVSGILLFLLGMEDVLYYLIQLRWLPPELAWLDYAPLMTLSRFLTRTDHVTATGVIISVSFGILLVSLIFGWKRPPGKGSPTRK